MNRIDFYILPSDAPEARWHFVGRLADKAARPGHRVLIAVDNTEQAKALDEHLWAQPEDSFLPHRRLGDTDAPPAAVEITDSEQCGDHRDVLINLRTAVPSHFEQFERLAEVVIQAPEVLKTTREHFSFYKSRGYPVRHQQL